MKTKFTPGPWSIHDKHGNHIVKGSGGNNALPGTPFICQSVSSAHRTAEEEAETFRLIARAPDMFELLVGVLRDVAETGTVSGRKCEQIGNLLKSISPEESK